MFLGLCSEPKKILFWKGGFQQRKHSQSMSLSFCSQAHLNSITIVSKCGKCLLQAAVCFQVCYLSVKTVSTGSTSFTNLIGSRGCANYHDFSLFFFTVLSVVVSQILSWQYSLFTDNSTIICCIVSTTDYIKFAVSKYMLCTVWLHFMWHVCLKTLHNSVLIFM